MLCLTRIMAITQSFTLSGVMFTYFIIDFRKVAFIAVIVTVKALLL